MEECRRITRSSSPYFLIGSGLWSRKRWALLPAPIPRNVRPGAIVLIDAMLWAVTGGIRVPATDTPVPIRIRSVRSAASAR